MEFLKAKKYFSTNYLVPTKLFSHSAPLNFILSTLKDYFAIHRASPTFTIIMFTTSFTSQTKKSRYIG